MLLVDKPSSTVVDWTARSGLNWLCLAVGAAGIGVLSVVHPVVAAAALGVLLLLLARYLPITPVLVSLLVLRATVDGSSAGNGLPGLGALATYSGISLAVVGLGLAIVRRRGLMIASVLSIFIVASNWYAVENYNAALWREGIRCLTIVATSLLILNTGNPIRFRTMVRIVQFTAMVPAVFSIYQFLIGTGMLVDGEVRPAGTLAHPNSAAVVFSIAIAMSVYQCARGRDVKLNLVASVAFSIAVVATASVGGVLTVLVMLVVLALAVTRVSWWLRVLTLFGTVLVAIGFSQSQVGSQRLAEFANLDFSDRPSNSLEWRVSAWRKILDVWREEPFFGRGLGATGSRLIGVQNIPHNEYVRLLTELGLVAFVVFALSIFVLVRRILFYRSLPGDTGDFANISLALLAGFFVNAAGANTLLYSVPAYLIVIVISGLFASKNQHFLDHQSGEAHQTSTKWI